MPKLQKIQRKICFQRNNLFLFYMHFYRPQKLHLLLCKLHFLKSEKARQFQEEERKAEDFLRMTKTFCSTLKAIFRKKKTMILFCLKLKAPQNRSRKKNETKRQEVFLIFLHNGKCIQGLFENEGQQAHYKIKKVQAEY